MFVVPATPLRLGLAGARELSGVRRKQSAISVILVTQPSAKLY